MTSTYFNTSRILNVVIISTKCLGFHGALGADQRRHALSHNYHTELNALFTSEKMDIPDFCCTVRFSQIRPSGYKM